MRHLLLLLLASSLVAGCAHSLGYAGAHPGYVKCKGKGVISGQGAIGASVGAGLNAFNLSADCGEGFELQQGKPEPAK